MTLPFLDIIPDNIIDKKVEILKALAHPIRLQIVNALIDNELSVEDIAIRLGTKKSLTSQRLSFLKMYGIVKSRRNGHGVFYSLKSKNIKNLILSILN